MELEGSLPCSQEPSSGLCLEMWFACIKTVCLEMWFACIKTAYYYPYWRYVETQEYMPCKCTFWPHIV